MTLSEQVAILGLDEIISIPSSIENLKIINSESTCRFAQMIYFKSITFYDDMIYILNELLTVLDTNLISIQDFALTFDNCANENLHLELTHNCY